MSQFVHLHLHSQYSLLDGANRIDDVLDAAVEAGMPAVALTDHGNMFGAIEFYQRARARKIKPIIGIEAYTSPESRHDRTPGRGSSNHLVLLAKNEAGYKNLLKLTSKSYLEGFYYKPRMDHELLRQHSEGVIALSACLKGEVNEGFMRRGEDAAESAARGLIDIFGQENFFLELQNHGIQEQIESNVVLRKLARKLGVRMVASNDCHYLRQSDARAHDVLLCIGTQKNVSDPDRLKYASDQFYMKSADEMLSLFPNDHQAVENTLAVAEMCDLEIPTGTFHLPEFPVPEGYTLESYFEEVAREGLDRRLDQLRRRNAQVLEKFSPELYYQRLATEIEIIKKMGFPGYFLVVWDFMRYSRENGIPVGPGRGSAAGSLVSYALRITDIDPLQYDLLFERFLNPDRISMPDIDIDFCMRRRGEVINYVSERYGKDRVAQIITFGTLAAKAVIRDVGRVMGVPYAKVDRIAKMVPDMTRSLALAAKDEPLKSEVKKDPDVAQIVEIGSRLEGLTRHASMHAAGVVITPRPTEELVPLYRVKKNGVETIMTQWDKDVVEDLGLLKMDFLGLRTLTVLDDAVKILRQQGVDIDLERLALDDDKTFQLFCDGKTSGVFQFESGGMKDLLRRARPSKFEDLAAFNALYRPGALSVGMVEEYIQRKLGKKKVSYTLPQTRAILEETYGVIVYQEQVMLIAVQVAGFTMAEADMLRKAMGKKSAEVMAKMKEKFVSGAADRGTAREKAAELWEYIEPFAGYGFNKSHSVAYALLAYQTAYLKAHHPVAFMAAMLNSEMGTTENVAKYIQETREMGIGLLPPDINRSHWDFTVEGEAVRFGLGAIRGIGEGAVNAVLEARRSVSRFESLAHFACEVDLKALNRKVFECLIKSGSFDAIEPNRRALWDGLDAALDFAQRRQRERDAGQVSLFGGAVDMAPVIDSKTPPWSDRERLSFEKETLGVYLTGNPLSEYLPQLVALGVRDIGSVKEDGAEGSVRIGGVVTRVRRTKIKSGPNEGRLMGRFVLEDLTGTLPVAVFANQLSQFGHHLVDEAVVVVQGQVRERGSDYELSAEEVIPVENRADRIDGFEVKLPADAGPDVLLRVRDVLIDHPGKVPVRLHLELPGRTLQIRPRADLLVDAGPELVTLLEGMLGSGAVYCQRPGA